MLLQKPVSARGRVTAGRDFLLALATKSWPTALRPRPVEDTTCCPILNGGMVAKPEGQGNSYPVGTLTVALQTYP